MPRQEGARALLRAASPQRSVTQCSHSPSNNNNTNSLGAAAAAAADPAADGPCGSERFERVAVLTPASSGCTLIDCALNVLVTKPTQRDGGCPAGPYPVVWLFSGFSARAGWYSYLARR